MRRNGARLRIPRRLLCFARRISLIVGGCNLRETSESQGLPCENALKICASRGKLSEKSFYFRLLRNQVLSVDFLSPRSCTTSRQRPSFRRRLYYPERRKIMSTYESAREVYELLSANESTLFLTNGNVSRRFKTHRVILL